MADPESMLAQNLKCIFNIQVERSSRQGIYEAGVPKGRSGHVEGLTTQPLKISLESLHPHCQHPGLHCLIAGLEAHHSLLVPLLTFTLVPVESIHYTAASIFTTASGTKIPFGHSMLGWFPFLSSDTLSTILPRCLLLAAFLPGFSQEWLLYIYQVSAQTCLLEMTLTILSIVAGSHHPAQFLLSTITL